MFLSQVPTTKGLRVNVIADIYVDNAKQRCLDIGWGQDRVEATQFTDDAFAMINDGEIDIGSIDKNVGVKWGNPKELKNPDY